MVTLMNNKKTRYLTKIDIIAIFFGIVISVYFFYISTYTEIETDESFYLTLAQRISLSDSPIIDEWSLIQLVFLLDVVPYLAFVGISGGNAGVLLFMRQVFIVFFTIYYFYLYFKVRSYRFWGLFGALLFFVIVPQTILCLNYSTISSMAMLMISISFFLEKRTSTRKLVIIGIIMGIEILAEPLTIFLFFIWFIFVLVREIQIIRKRPVSETYEFFLDKRVFLRVSIGAFIVFCVFIVTLILMGSFHNIMNVLPYLFNGRSYNFRKLFKISSIRDSLDFYGYVFPCGLLLTVIVAGFLKMIKKLNMWNKLILFTVSCILLVCCLFNAGVKANAHYSISKLYAFILYHNVPMMLFSPIPFLLSEKNDKRYCLFLIAGVLYSLFTDMSSQFSLGTGGNIIRIPLFIQMSFFLQSLKEDFLQFKHDKTKRKKAQVSIIGISKSIVILCGVFVLMWHVLYLWTEGMEKGLLKVKKDDTELIVTDGPFKNMKMPKAEADIYYDTLQDLNVIKENIGDGRVCILDESSFCYLYLNQPYATYSALFEEEYARQAVYWSLSKTHEPTYIYIPYYEFFSYQRYNNKKLQEKLDQVFLYVDGNTKEGKAGYIIQVTNLIPLNNIK